MSGLAGEHCILATVSLGSARPHFFKYVLPPLRLVRLGFKTIDLVSLDFWEIMGCAVK